MALVAGESENDCTCGIYAYNEQLQSMTDPIIIAHCGYSSNLTRQLYEV